MKLLFYNILFALLCFTSIAYASLKRNANSDNISALNESILSEGKERLNLTTAIDEVKSHLKNAVDGLADESLLNEEQITILSQAKEAAINKFNEER